MQSINVTCRCSKTRLRLHGDPILVSECLCSSCRTAADRLSRLPLATNFLTPYGATPCAEYRKDRVVVTEGAENLGEFRLVQAATTRRVLATCCNTPLFLEMKGAHWVSVYLHLWPTPTRPRPQLRTMTKDLGDKSALPDDIPNLDTHSFAFYFQLFKAWVAMGFKKPKILVRGRVDA